MKLSADKKKLHLAINAELNTEDVEILISELAELRANMTPPVSMNRPLSGQHVIIQNDPSIFSIPLKDGRVRFWLRNQGIGWMAYDLTIQQSTHLRDFLISNTPDEDGSPSLFRDEGTDKGSAH